jgi:hypothetical protein
MCIIVLVTPSFVEGICRFLTSRRGKTVSGGGRGGGHEGHDGPPATSEAVRLGTEGRSCSVCPSLLWLTDLSLLCVAGRGKRGRRRRCQAIFSDACIDQVRPRSRTNKVLWLWMWVWMGRFRYIAQERQVLWPGHSSRAKVAPRPGQACVPVVAESGWHVENNPCVFNSATWWLAGVR